MPTEDCQLPTPCAARPDDCQLPTADSARSAVVLCGGKGTRLGAEAQDLPKPLVDIAGRPLLDLVLERLREAGIRKAILAAGHLGDRIADHYREHPLPGLDIEVHLEQEARGTAGCLHEVADRLEDQFLVVYGDVYLDLDLRPLLERHSASDALATLLVRASDHPWDSDLVEADAAGRVRAFHRPGHHPPLARNTANAALFACSKAILEAIPKEGSSDFSRNIFPAVLARGGFLQTYALPEQEFVKDMGTPDRLSFVRSYETWKQSVRATAAITSRPPVRVAFLDRDGTLIEGDGPVKDPTEICFLPGVLDGLRQLHEHGIRCFVLTNQPWIARGELTREQVDRVHAALQDQVAQAGGRIEAFYYCPHHPETHHGDGIPELRTGCHCRKPQPGLLRQACAEHQLRLEEAVLIGDTDRDLDLARTCQIPGWLVQPGKNGDTVHEPMRSLSFLHACRRILQPVAA